MDIAARSESFLYQASKGVGRGKIHFDGSPNKWEKNLSFLELGKGIFDNMSDTKVKSMFVREKPAFVLCGMSGFFQSGANHGARCQSRQNPLGLSSEDRI